MKTTTVQSAQATARGYRVKDFAEQEGVAISTVWRWIHKQAVVVSRVAPSTGVRVRYADGEPVASRRIR